MRTIIKLYHSLVEFSRREIGIYTPANCVCVDILFSLCPYARSSFNIWFLLLILLNNVSEYSHYFAGNIISTAY